MKPACKCLERVNKKMDGFTLTACFSFHQEKSGKCRTYSLPALTVTRTNKSRTKQPTIIPLFCPFCGKEYEK